MSALNNRPASAAGETPPARHNSRMEVGWADLSELKLHPGSARRYNASDEKRAAKIVHSFGVQMPLLIDQDSVIRVGELIYLAAKRLGIESVPVRRIDGLTAAELDALQVAYARLGELGDWDQQMLAQIVINCETEIVGFDVGSIGFDIGEIDIAIGSTDAEDDEPALNELVADSAVSAVGDLWLVGKHRVLCADATEATSIAFLMAGACAAAVFSDPPFGCKIDGFVAGKGRHREFVMASGEMSDDELLIFFTAFIKAFLPSLKSGAVVYLVIDWRSLHLLLDAARPLLGKLLNLAVWAKDRAGMGSWLRSQHELILIFKAGSGRYRNNVQLGKYGRDRSNVWSYPSAKTASTGSDEGDILAAHPTPKPVRLVADAILDCTKRNDVILDVFLGSGTTLIAAEKVGRRCYATELDPLYVDLAIRRWQAWTGGMATHAATGKTFDQLALERSTSI